MLSALFQKQKAFFLSGQTLPLSFRRKNLLRLKSAMLDREPQLLAALREDLGKPEIEAFTSELGLVLAEINLALKSLSSWSRPRPRRTARLHWPAKSYVYPRPRGVVLILGPWNYPVQLVMLPLVGALAAGNCAVIKPSELASATARILEDLIQDTFPPEYCHVAQGDAQAAATYLELPWDHIFFTGSSRVGRLVMQAAAQHPTSVTLELGGKNPCVVMPDVDLDLTAERIAWGKFLNAGQTCGAPDHVYVQAQVKDQLVEALRQALRRFYGADPRQSQDYARIVNTGHFDRLIGYLPQGKVLAGGAHDRSSKYIAPTLLDQVSEDSLLMQEEIFGPVLPVLSFTDFDALLAKLQTRPLPLAAYLFTRDRAVQQKFLDRLQCGSVAFNDTVSQITTPDLPLGGVGESGIGAYHGQASFDCFSHLTSVMAKGFTVPGRMKYPPYTVPLTLLKKIYKWLV